MFIILIGITIPAIIKLSDSNLDSSLFITVYELTVTFWYLDGFTYFYQEKLRTKMDERFVKLKNRNNNDVVESEIDEYIILATF